MDVLAAFAEVLPDDRSNEVYKVWRPVYNVIDALSSLQLCHQLTAQAAQSGKHSAQRLLLTQLHTLHRAVSDRHFLTDYRYISHHKRPTLSDVQYSSVRWRHKLCLLLEVSSLRHWICPM